MTCVYQQRRETYSPVTGVKSVWFDLSYNGVTITYPYDADLDKALTGAVSGDKFTVIMTKVKA